MTGFFAAFGGKVAESWALLVLTPAFAFWGGGVAAWAWSRGWNDGWSDLGDALADLSGAEQLALAVGVFVFVTVSGIAVQRATLPILRLLEGYWPTWFDPVRRRIVGIRAHRIDRLQRERDALADKVAGNHASPDERRRYLLLDQRLRRVPTEAREGEHIRRMPTSLGNVLRAAESWPSDKYGLDAVKCWPRVWLVLPETTRTELTAARASVDAAANVVTWALLFLVWTVWAWWAAPIGVLVAVGAHRMLLASAAVFGDLLEATFDVHRGRLYDALRWPRPQTPAEERALGRALTEYLWRGSDAERPSYTMPIED